MLLICPVQIVKAWGDNSTPQEFHQDSTDHHSCVNIAVSLIMVSFSSGATLWAMVTCRLKLIQPLLTAVAFFKHNLHILCNPVRLSHNTTTTYFKTKHTFDGVIIVWIFFTEFLLWSTRPILKLKEKKQTEALMVLSQQAQLLGKQLTKNKLLDKYKSTKSCAWCSKVNQTNQTLL